MSALLDTNIVIDCLRGARSGNRLLQSACNEALDLRDHGRRDHGWRSQSARGEGCGDFWSMVKPRGVSHDIASRAGVFVRLYRASNGVELADALIAATAEQHALPLATLNVKHFPMFRRLKAPY